MIEFCLFTVLQEATQTAGDVVLRVFNKVIVQISIDRSNIQHQKLSLKLVTPEVSAIQIQDYPHFIDPSNAEATFVQNTRM